MASAQPGWYPDPSGDATKLRYWDGTQWTDNYTANPQQQAAQAAPQQPQADPAQQQGAQQQPYGTANTAATVNVYTTPVAVGQQYNVSDKDKTLRLIAFIFSCISIAYWAIFGIFTLGIGLIGLAWTIPMTVHTWGIYKGKKANSVAFGVCMLIFTNLVSGILLLVSEKEK